VAGARRQRSTRARVDVLVQVEAVRALRLPRRFAIRPAPRPWPTPPDPDHRVREPAGSCADSRPPSW
jgi:hypothetical protein